MNGNPLNRLDQESSPYLKQLAGHPVNWYPWCKKAFEVAKQRNKPIFLSIGAPWCPWCKQMDQDSLNHNEVFKLLNDFFVCIKVDRDEHPQIDRRYQEASSLLTGQGGWPLSAFLTPEGDCFYAHSAVVQAKEGELPLVEMLKTIIESWRKQPQPLKEKGREITQTLMQSKGLSPGPGFSPSLCHQALDDLAMAFDIRHGGFGKSPKFPHPNTLEHCLMAGLGLKEDWLRQSLFISLKGLTQGGLQDYLQGDYFRLSHSVAWSEPEFEKCLADNAALLRVFSLVRRLSGVSVPIESLLEGLSQFWVRENGVFVSAWLAESNEGELGGPYYFTTETLRQVLTAEEFAVAEKAFALEELGQVGLPPGKNLLVTPQKFEKLCQELGCSDEELGKQLGDIRQKILTWRNANQVPVPVLDVFVYSQALMAEALFEAWRSTGNPRAYELANELTNTLLRTHLMADKGMLHAVRELPGGKRREIEGLLEDQGATLCALVQAFECTGQRTHLKVAEELADLCIEGHAVDEGAFVDIMVHADAPGLMKVPLLSWQDTPTASGNALMARALDRLGHCLGRQDFVNWSGKILNTLSGPMARYPLYTGALHAHGFRVQQPLVMVVVSGDEKSPEFQALHRQALSLPIPNLLVFPVLKKQWQEGPEFLANLPKQDSSGLAHLLVDGKHLGEVKTPEELLLLTQKV